MNFPKFTAASVIASPAMFDLSGTVNKCCSYIEEASENGAKLVVFPETFIPMYPWWIWMSVNNVKKLELYKDLYKNSVDIHGSEFKKIRDKASECNVYVVVGINEINSMTLYNSQVFINDQGEIIGKRRKLVPTGEERTIWGRGDGSDLFVCDTDIGKLSGLVCYENSMPLSRYALYSMGAQIHIANWPGSNFKSQPRDRTKIIDLTSRFAAFEGQMFVIASSSYLGEEELAFYKELDPSLGDSLTVGGGIAGIISPFGEYVSRPLQDEEGIAYGEIDLEAVLDSKHLLDSVGHYARGDVAKLLLNKEDANPVKIKNNDTSDLTEAREGIEVLSSTQDVNK
ncbi:carbon-nitrogen hydrolase family protein [Oceanobacillus halotolerans]|uniref:carbon-nitrogen hydrolase family protein n=1 Tax=Oceanobacillus halotolerans TaxID=2663380 RepID=UPI0013DBA727|nr:carbon-nitrogen hydrolase family protein [Oceanobacillus halotolerans]